jgi:4'-phosphopantetheinyl transferase
MSSGRYEWRRMPERMELEPNRAHVVRFRLDLPESKIGSLAGLLDEDESCRADRFRFARLRRRFVAAHGGLRRLLGIALDQDPAVIRFETGPQGKPFLAVSGEMDLQFNLSHSENLALVAVTTGQAVGIDLELKKGDLDLLGTARTCFADRELARLEAEAEAIRSDVFYSYWTCKEAYIKARGGGLSIPLKAFAIGDLTPGDGWRPVIGSSASTPDWHVCELSPEQDFAAALCVRGRLSAVDCWDWSWDS